MPPSSQTGSISNQLIIYSRTRPNTAARSPLAGVRPAAALPEAAADAEAEALPVAKPVCGPLSAPLDEEAMAAVALGLPPPGAAADDDGTLEKFVNACGHID